jgi:hypothetical protein
VRPRRSAIYLAAFPLFAGMLFGQSSSGTISGRVVDSSGGAITGAEVRAINQEDRTSRSFTTTSTGDFVFSNVDPGTYTLSVKAAGFKLFEKSDLHLSASESLAAGDIKLQVGAVTETVQVKAQGAMVETASTRVCSIRRRLRT